MRWTPPAILLAGLLGVAFCAFAVACVWILSALLVLAS